MPDPTIAELFEEVVEGAEVFAERPVELLAPSTLSGFENGYLVFQGRNWRTYDRLCQRLAASALSTGGRSLGAAGSLVTRACREALSSGIARGLALLEQELGTPLGEWTVIESIRGAFYPQPIRVGRAWIHSSLETVEGAETAGLLAFPQMRFDPPLIATKVRAFDQESAHRRALDIFEESKSILNLAGWPARPLHGAWGLIKPDGHGLTSSESTDRFHPGGVNESGWLRLGFRGLERAARKEGTERSDWEGRSVYAARWLRRANLTTWPSEALSACMNALDALFIRDRGVRDKGKTIARGVANHFTSTAVLTSEQVYEWLRGLYRHRNEVVHDGRHYLEDYEVDRLLGLTTMAVEWASWHLDDDHDHLAPCRACQTFDEAMSSAQK